MTSIKLAKFRPVRADRNGLMREQVVNQVRVMIKEGKLKPGDRIPPERELARQLGISRTSLRAGLRFLGAIGVLTSRHGSGTYVADGPPALASEPLHMLAALHGFTAKKMFEARRVIEVAVAGLAAENAKDDQLMRISEEVSETYAALDDPQEYLIHDFGFPRAVAAASGNPILSTVMGMVSDVLYQRRTQTVNRARDLKQSVDMHRKIYRAIRARDAQAARTLMSEHLMQAERDFISEEVSDGLLNEIDNQPASLRETDQLGPRQLAESVKRSRKTA
jgi:GntR family transcriptional regulator, transcriptional repressor for pyruvate dehydrogenase complex